jgi:hypothetical protein
LANNPVKHQDRGNAAESAAKQPIRARSPGKSQYEVFSKCFKGHIR